MPPRSRLRRIGGAGALAVVAALVVGTAFGFTGSDRSAFRGQVQHEALVVQGQHGSEVLAPVEHAERNASRGLRQLAAPLAVAALLVASGRRARRLLTPGDRLGWRTEIAVRRRGPPLPVAA